jgi:hypothetical protein
MSTIDPRRGDAVLPPPAGTIQPPRGYATPTVAMPPAVEEADGHYSSLLEQFAECADRRREARELVTVRQAEDIREDIARVEAGEKPLPTGKRQGPVAEAAFAEASREVQVLAGACKIAGLKLRDAVAATKAEWLVAIEAEEKQAVAVYTDAVKELEQAAARLGSIRGAHRWVSEANSRELPDTKSGGSIQVRIGGNRDFGANEVLAALANAAQPSKPARRTATPGESVFAFIGAQ